MTHLQAGAGQTVGTDHEEALGAGGLLFAQSAQVKMVLWDSRPVAGE
nr:hypothetical protein [Streptomyces sp. WAC 06725]